MDQLEYLILNHQRATKPSQRRVRSLGIESIARPAPFSQPDHLRPVFEVHRIEMVPFPSPNEPMLLKDVNDLEWNAVDPGELPLLFLSPYPVVAVSIIDIDGSTIAMDRSPVGFRDRAAVIDA